MTGFLEYRDKAAVVRCVRAQRQRTVALLEDLRTQQWEQPVLPGWRVREVAAHLVSTDEAALTGRMLRLGLRAVRIEDLEEWNETQVLRWSHKPVMALLHGLDIWGGRLSRAVALTPSRVARRRIPSPLGRVSLLWLAMMRVYDEWVHMEDVRRALGLPSDDDLTALTPVATHLLAAVPVQTLPRVPLSAAGSVALVLTDVATPPLGIDFAARRYGVGLATKAAVHAPAATMIMVAAGRDRWREVEERGDLSVEGDEKAAEFLLDALLVV